VMRRIWMTALMAALTPATMIAQGPGAGEPTVFAPGVSVLNLMSTEQFAAAGLSKLSPAELRALSEWVRAHSLTVADLARTAALNPEPAPSSNPGMMETRMAGDFTGWDGGTVFEFVNGQVWRQTSFGTLHQYARSPKVTLVATGSGWRMQVEGVPQSIYVRRVR
ncbi:MAG TPA: hypothetical protein VMM77_00240, partial [Gemmatimonadaceae bacterium]|nr:hypothetical protein [Gemmatimonadaceae bacterium]